MGKQRAVVCVENPQDFIPQLSDYSLMVVNPNCSESRLKYLLDNSDWSLLITKEGEQYRDGGSYSNEDVLWYTSGTTGDSKFCSFTRAHLDIMAKKICKTYNITANDQYVSIMPLWHAHGQGLYWATKLVQCETNYVTVKTIRDIAKYQPSFISAIPEILKTISHLDLGSLRFIRSCSSPMSHSLYQHLREKYQVPVVEAFGMTETLSHCFTNPLYGEQRIGTVGLPDGIEANIVDGRLYVAGPTVVSAGWFDTGDLAEQDDKGYYKILGRHRDQINVKGIKFNPTSLESQLKANITGMADCVIFGTDSVKCLYVGDCNADDINKFLISLDRHCRPVLLRRVDSIPISPSGKISRTWLQQFVS